VLTLLLYLRSNLLKAHDRRTTAHSTEPWRSTSLATCVVEVICSLLLQCCHLNGLALPHLCHLFLGLCILSEEAIIAEYFYRALKALLAAWCVITLKIMMCEVLLTNTRCNLLIKLCKLLQYFIPLSIFINFLFFYLMRRGVLSYIYTNGR
jgi:hypothetical protein